MDIIATVIRKKETKDSTLGEFYWHGGKFLAYILEDGFREKKEAGKTRIPAGTYEVELRDDVGLYGKYMDRFGPDHKIIVYKDVPGFRYIEMHIGNFVEDTDGCQLPGLTYWLKDGNYALSQSEAAYLDIHERITREKAAGNRVFICVKEDL